MGNGDNGQEFPCVPSSPPTTTRALRSVIIRDARQRLYYLSSSRRPVPRGRRWLVNAGAPGGGNDNDNASTGQLGHAPEQPTRFAIERLDPSPNGSTLSLGGTGAGRQRGGGSS